MFAAGTTNWPPTLPLGIGSRLRSPSWRSPSDLAQIDDGACVPPRQSNSAVVDPRNMGNGWVCLAQGSDRLDLNELMGVTQHRDTQQCAGWVVVTKVVSDHTPGRLQIFAATADDVHGG